MSEDKAKQMGLKPLARIKGYASGGVDPAYMGLGPVPAVRKLLRITGTSVKDYGLFELNEAFASQAISCLRELNIPWDITQRQRFGHFHRPSGRLLRRTHRAGAGHEMNAATWAWVWLPSAIGGGQGMAIAIEAV